MGQPIRGTVKGNQRADREVPQLCVPGRHYGCVYRSCGYAGYGKKSARVGYTKILDHVTAYYLSHDPSPILVVQPRVEDAEDYSKTEIMPMLRDTPALADICPDPKAKDSNQTILKKRFQMAPT